MADEKDFCPPRKENFEGNAAIQEIKKRLQEAEIVKKKMDIYQRLYAHATAKRELAEEELSNQLEICRDGHVKPLRKLCKENLKLAKLAEALQLYLDETKEQVDQLKEKKTELQMQLVTVKRYNFQLEQQVEKSKADIEKQRGIITAKFGKKVSGKNLKKIHKIIEEEDAKKKKKENLEQDLARHANNIRFILKKDYFKTFTPAQKEAVKFCCSFGTFSEAGENEKTARVKSMRVIYNSPTQIRSNFSETEFLNPVHAGTSPIKSSQPELMEDIDAELKTQSTPLLKPCTSQAEETIFTLDAASLEDKFKVNVKLPIQQGVEATSFHINFDAGFVSYHAEYSDGTKTLAHGTFSLQNKQSDSLLEKLDGETKVGDNLLNKKMVSQDKSFQADDGSILEKRQEGMHKMKNEVSLKSRVKKTATYRQSPVEQFSEEDEESQIENNPAELYSQQTKLQQLQVNNIKELWNQSKLSADEHKSGELFKHSVNENDCGVLSIPVVHENKDGVLDLNGEPSKLVMDENNSG